MSYLNNNWLICLYFIPALIMFVHAVILCITEYIADRKKEFDYEMTLTYGDLGCAIIVILCPIMNIIGCAIVTKEIMDTLADKPIASKGK